MSTDGGATFTRVMSDRFSSGFTLATNGASLFATSDALWRKGSPDGAWQQLKEPADEVLRFAVIGDSILSVSESGFLRATDPSLGWEPVTLEGALKDVTAGALWDYPAVFARVVHGRSRRRAVPRARGTTRCSLPADGGRTFVRRTHPTGRHDVYIPVNFRRFDWGGGS